MEIKQVAEEIDGFLKSSDLFIDYISEDSGILETVTFGPLTRESEGVWRIDDAIVM